jgi:hypothetical protein
MAEPSPQKPRESEQEFNRLLRGEGSPQRLVTAIKKESRTYVSEVRDGRYRGSRTAGRTPA